MEVLADLTPSQRAYMPVAQTTDWATPTALMDQIWAEFKPDLDPCGAREHHYSAWLIEHHGGRFMDGSTEAMDGLTQSWHCRCAYVNPPYGRGISAWIEKAVQEVACGHAGMVVALLPVRTDTRWWQRRVMTSAQRGFPPQKYHMKAHEVRFLPGRLKFGESKNAAPFPSAIVVWAAAGTQEAEKR